MEPERKMYLIDRLSFVTGIPVILFEVYVWLSEGFSFWNPKILVVAGVFIGFFIVMEKLRSRAYEEWISD